MKIDAGKKLATTLEKQNQQFTSICTVTVILCEVLCGYNHNAVVVIKVAAYVYSWCILSMAAYYYNFMVVHLIDTKSKQCGSVLIICG